MVKNQKREFVFTGIGLVKYVSKYLIITDMSTHVLTRRVGSTPKKNTPRSCAMPPHRRAIVLSPKSRLPSTCNGNGSKTPVFFRSASVTHNLGKLLQTTSSCAQNNNDKNNILLSDTSTGLSLHCLPQQPLSNRRRTLRVAHVWTYANNITSVYCSSLSSFLVFFSSVQSKNGFSAQ